MKTWLWVVPLLLVGQQVVRADEFPSCPPGTFLERIGSVASTASATTNVAASGHAVRASRVACGGTACRATIYDSSTAAGRVNGNIKEEPGSAANTSAWTDYFPPLRFTTGIDVAHDANVVGTLLFECR